MRFIDQDKTQVKQIKYIHHDRLLCCSHVHHGNENQPKLLYILAKHMPETRRIKIETKDRNKIHDYNQSQFLLYNRSTAQMSNEWSRKKCSSNLKQWTQVLFIFICTVKEYNCRPSLLNAFLQTQNQQRQPSLLSFLQSKVNDSFNEFLSWP